MNKLELSKKDYEEMVNLVPQLLCIWDLGGCFKFLNPTLEKIFGYGVNEMMGLNFYSIIHPEDKVLVINHIESQIFEKK